MYDRHPSEIAVRHVAFDGALGAMFGLLVILVIDASSLGVGQTIAVGSDLMPWLAVVGFVIVAQFALAGGLCGFALRRISMRR
ncbi:MAG TPA: hypothetical protein VN715_04920 [Roseiarcus sp.]|nr:hypothetical protein [Roseiarcus sp.]